MTIEIHQGTGRAHCRLCEKRIEEHELQFKSSEFRNITNYHVACVEKMIYQHRLFADTK